MPLKSRHPMQTSREVRHIINKHGGICVMKIWSSGPEQTRFTLVSLVESRVVVDEKRNMRGTMKRGRCIMMRGLCSWLSIRMTRSWLSPMTRITFGASQGPVFLFHLLHTSFRLRWARDIWMDSCPLSSSSPRAVSSSARVDFRPHASVYE